MKSVKAAAPLAGRRNSGVWHLVLELHDGRLRTVAADAHGRVRRRRERDVTVLTVEGGAAAAHAGRGADRDIKGSRREALGGGRTGELSRASEFSPRAAMRSPCVRPRVLPARGHEISSGVRSGASPPSRWWLGRGGRCHRRWRRGGRGAVAGRRWRRRGSWA